MARGFWILDLPFLKRAPHTGRRTEIMRFGSRRSARIQRLQAVIKDENSPSVLRVGHEFDRADGCDGCWACRARRHPSVLVLLSAGVWTSAGSHYARSRPSPRT